VDSARLLERHALTQPIVWRVGDLEVPLRTKVGVRGYPGVDEALIALADAAAPRPAGAAGPGARPDRRAGGAAGVGGT
jgi:hypothetical protein